MKKVSISLILAFIMLSLSACSHNTVNTDMQTTQQIISGILYNNQKYGFTLVFPDAWKNKYCIIESDNNIKIYHKATWEKNKGGVLFTITIFKPKSKWETEGKALEDAIGMRKIYEDDLQVFGFSTPTDVQYILDDKDLSEDYKLMENSVNDIKILIKKTN